MSARSCLAVLALLSGTASAQLAVRPDDPEGLSPRVPRVRVSTETSRALIVADPWQAYQRGRALFFREWSTDDGVFSHLTTRPEAAATNSCGMCHNLPFPSPGFGGTAVGPNRTAPHLFGVGLLETIGMQIRARILIANDTNHNGYLDVPAETRGRRAIVTAAPGVTVDFGSLEDADGSGLPDLDSMLMVRIVDRNELRTDFDLHGAPIDLRSPAVRGYDIAAGVLARSIGDHQFASLRIFAAGVLLTVFGLLPEGTVKPLPVGSQGLLIGEWGAPTFTGAFTTELVVPKDPGNDPARPKPGTVSEGELDLLEWFLLNSPRPALGKQSAATRRGRVLLRELGCTGCHVESWVLDGDRRFFDLAVTFNDEADRLEGKLTTRGPGRQPFTVTDVFTDLKHHDLGERFWEYQRLNGRTVVLKKFRTSPLWGIGSAFAFGHDGRSSTLEDVIRRHGGEAAPSTQRWERASAADRDAVTAFLRSLLLYAPESIPTDLDGDGTTGGVFRARGRSVGPELFRPEYLCVHTPVYAGWQAGPDGRFFSWALKNAAQVYLLGRTAAK